MNIQHIILYLTETPTPHATNALGNTSVFPRNKLTVDQMFIVLIMEGKDGIVHVTSYRAITKACVSK